MNRPPVPYEPVPDGLTWQAAPDRRWRVLTGRRCRFGAGHKTRGCGQPAVAELDRSHSDRPIWWAYCETHLYGRWIENGEVHQWVLGPPAA